MLLNQYIKQMMNQIVSISESLKPGDINVWIDLIENLLKSEKEERKEILEAINSLMSNKLLTTLEKE